LTVSVTSTYVSIGMFNEYSLTKLSKGIITSGYCTENLLNPKKYHWVTPLEHKQKNTWNLVMEHAYNVPLKSYTFWIIKTVKQVCKYWTPT